MRRARYVSTRTAKALCTAPSVLQFSGGAKHTTTIVPNRLKQFTPGHQPFHVARGKFKQFRASPKTT
eukprot:7063319-Alexandrium_andersonii.AAC.1